MDTILYGILIFMTGGILGMTVMATMIVGAETERQEEALRNQYDPER